MLNLRFFKIVLIILSLLFLNACEDKSSGSSTADSESGDTESGYTDTNVIFYDSDSNIIDDSEDTDDQTDSGESFEIFPHKVGNWWLFKYENIDAAGGSCEPGDWKAEILSMKLVDNIETYSYLNPCIVQGIQSTILLQFEGNKTYYANEGYYYIDTPIEQDYEWPSPKEGNFRWDAVDTITVPAGTFNNCWDKVYEPTDNHLIFCPNVGRVKGYTGTAYKSELVDYHLE
ncbi:MAG: hypothetical protein JXR91_14325 [Deltaproteobacteria bacterium]|nr:hypothetical protein [Deltaproteobacteria bacterium]